MGAEILLGDSDVSQVRRTGEADLDPGGYACRYSTGGHAGWFSATVSVSLLAVVALSSSDRTPGRRRIDREIQSYLADVEGSLVQASLHESQLEEALATRTTIGQAVGLLMAQGGLTSDQAFQKLVHASQTTNLKLRDIAERYVETWEEKVQ